MNYGNVLPITGGAGAMIAGHFLGLDDIIAAALAVVLFGIALYRYASRIGEGRNTVLIAAASITLGLIMVAHVAGISWQIGIMSAFGTAVITLAIVARVQQSQAGRVA